MEYLPWGISSGPGILQKGSVFFFPGLSAIALVELSTPSLIVPASKSHSWECNSVGAIGQTLMNPKKKSQKGIKEHNFSSMTQPYGLATW